LSSDLANILRRSRARKRARYLAPGWRALKPHHDSASVQTAAEDFSSRDEPTTVAPKLPHTREGAPFRVLNLHTLHDFAGNPLSPEAAQVLFQRGRRQDRAPPDVDCFLTTHYRQAKGDSQNLFNIATRVAGRQSGQPKSTVLGLAGRFGTGIAFLI
jgi:hypothetical protein